MRETTVLKVDELHVRFDHGGQRVHAVNGLTYQLRAGRTLAIIGESGSGKTVSTRALMGLLPTTATVTGSARLDGVELVGLPEDEMRRHRGADIAMVFQDPTRSLNPTMRIGTQITEAVRAHTEVAAAAARERAVELLSLVRIPDPQRRFHEYPAPALRRHAPASDDRDRAGLGSQGARSPTRPPPRWTSPPRRRSWSCSPSCARGWAPRSS